MLDKTNEKKTKLSIKIILRIVERISCSDDLIGSLDLTDEQICAEVGRNVVILLYIRQFPFSEGSFPDAGKEVSQESEQDYLQKEF